MDLSGKSVLITGASRGLGVDMARAFAQRGSKLVLAARSAEDLESVAKDLSGGGAEVRTVAADVADRTSLDALVKAAGPVDVLVNNAGVENVADFETQDLDTIEQILRINLIGLTWLTRLVLPSMVERRSGHVVNIASTAGINPVPHNAVYSASKHAVVGLSRSLRAEMADHNIGVSVVCPGFVEGGMFLQWGRKAPKTVGSVTPEKVADAVIKAVVKNKAEIIVAPGLSKLSDVSAAISPDMSIGLMKRMGVVDYLREQARINSSR